MPWRISCRHRGSVAVLDLVGGTSSEEEDGVYDTVLRLWQEGDRRFLLNMAGVFHLGNLGGVVRTYTYVVRQGGGFGLAAVRPRETQILNITRLSTRIRVFDTEDAGVQSLEAEGTQADPTSTDPANG